LLFKEGFIPGVVYGQDDDKNTVKTLIGVNQKILAKELREKGTTFENTLYEIVVDGEHGPLKVLVTPRQTQFNPGIRCFS
jgi:ribosomal protein L25 (general stress protein Ctc)